MITVSVEQKQGTTTRRVSVSAPTIERAVEIARRGAEEARLLFPIDGERFFAPASGEGIRYGEQTAREVETPNREEALV